MRNASQLYFLSSSNRLPLLHQSCPLFTDFVDSCTCLTTSKNIRPTCILSRRIIILQLAYRPQYVTRLVHQQLQALAEATSVLSDGIIERIGFFFVIMSYTMFTLLYTYFRRLRNYSLITSSNQHGVAL